MNLGLWEVRQTFQAYCMWMDDELNDKEFVDILHQLYLAAYEEIKERDAT